MSTIKRGEGNVVPVVAGGTYTSGVPELIGSILFGVPVADAVSGDHVGLEITGVHALPKTGGGGITFALGALVYWNQSSHKATATPTDTLVGVCVEAAADADTSVKTRLVGQAQTKAPLSGTATITAGSSSKSVAVDAAYNGRPVVVTVKGLSGGTGAFHATLPIVVTAEVTGGNLVLTSRDAISAAATNVASNVICYYEITVA